MYASLRAAAADLERTGQLIRISETVDPDLEMAEIHRQVFDRRGPAILFERVKGSPFQAISNVYGTPERTDFLFRKTLPAVQKVVELKADPASFAKDPLRYAGSPLTALSALPRRHLRPAVKYARTTIDQLPLVKSWPMDGGAFVTLPQVCTLPPGSRKPMESNIGMYRIQLTGNDYRLNEEVGLHYQLHRGIGVHHTEYNRSDAPFRCSVFVGGPPSHAFSAIMPLPEGLSEMTFAGMLAGRRFGYAWDRDWLLSADADFVITGTIRKGEKKPEGPFGDHLGYYSLEHDFPVMDVEAVWHRKDPLWHFTVVGRPPAEDSSFGYLIHKIVKKLTPGEFPGIRQINAVDEAGVHPLLLAIGSERYMPFRERVPEEIITQANRILGSGQTSLAKYCLIAADEDDPALNADDQPGFFRHLLERFDPTRDLHFQTRTTIDTLDYSGSGWNAGSKLIWACRGDRRRELSATVPDALELAPGFGRPRVVAPGILAVQGPAFTEETGYASLQPFLRQRAGAELLARVPLIVVCDDSEFLAASFANFVWVTFTRSNPSHDVHGVDAFTEHKHWGCRGPVVIDARIKPWHAPGLVPDPAVQERAAAIVDRYLP
ncbi:4-hydroxy-3-polyprenylbenzoate decarboxylase [Lewinella marina]|uniref:3-octaprenyl-4-hydroxybenzoate carboxy-lyase n=1 Tax=Neolewinella marina TaxID=438751 RepID=A0A2G0CGM1_9BACT|nr:UbiD family decarboxylase [Neolewinella marina]NJB86430.1 4-hydroxy-3-polyprenylbenzoate decarboxylase [Neolewinella marina]PHK99108.1 3-octaprenyl-4-hydroxybenzoate carboxy-lyase [Neolewinella marina]